MKGKKYENTPETLNELYDVIAKMDVNDDAVFHLNKKTVTLKRTR